MRLRHRPVQAELFTSAHGLSRFSSALLFLFCYVISIDSSWDHERLTEIASFLLSARAIWISRECVFSGSCHMLADGRRSTFSLQLLGLRSFRTQHSQLTYSFFVHKTSLHPDWQRHFLSLVCVCVCACVCVGTCVTLSERNGYRGEFLHCLLVASWLQWGSAEQTGNCPYNMRFASNNRVLPLSRWRISRNLRYELHQSSPLF